VHGQGIENTRYEVKVDPESLRPPLDGRFVRGARSTYSRLPSFFCISYGTIHIRAVEEERRTRSLGRQRHHFPHAWNLDEGDEVGKGLLVLVGAE